MPDFMGLRFADGTTAVVQRRPGEVWEATVNRGATRKYGPITVDTVRMHLRGTAATTWQPGPRKARAAAERLPTPDPYAVRPY